jgi:CheY-like chemotaxis protein
VKILVVDDSQLDRKLLVRTLQKAGVENEILQAADGESAMDCLNVERKNICLIFLDWQLPKVDGLEVLKQIARDPETSAIPVIMLTSTSNPENEEIAQLLNPHLAAFVVKPLDPEKVIKAALPHIK